MEGSCRHLNGSTISAFAGGIEKNPTVSSTVCHVPVHTDLLLLQWHKDSHYSWPGVSRSPCTVNNRQTGGRVAHFAEVLSEWLYMHAPTSPIHLFGKDSCESVPCLPIHVPTAHHQSCNDTHQTHTWILPSNFCRRFLGNCFTSKFPHQNCVGISYTPTHPRSLYQIYIGKVLHIISLTALALKYMHDFIFAMNAKNLSHFFYLRTT